MIGVAGRDDLETFATWTARNGVDGFDHIADANLAVWKAYDITSQPAFAFINDDGTSESRIGAMGLESLTAKVEQLIAA